MNFAQIKKLISLKRRSGAGIQTVDEFKELAKKRIPNAIWDFIEGGAGTEQAIQANRKSLESVLFQPKYLVDVSQRNT